MRAASKNQNGPYLGQDLGDQKSKKIKDIEMSDEQSYAEDDKDMSLDKKAGRGRKKHHHEPSNEVSAPPENKSDTEDGAKDGRKKGRHMLRNKGNRGYGDGKVTVTQSVAGETTANELSTEKKPRDDTESKNQNLTAQQIIAKNLGRPEIKERKTQMVGFNTIKTITKIMHMQQKALGLKVTGDEMYEKQIDKNNSKQLQSYRMKNYKLADQTNGQYFTLYKTIRRIEQEEKVLGETAESVFQEAVPNHVTPLDVYEQEYLRSQGLIIPEP